MVQLGSSTAYQTVYDTGVTDPPDLFNSSNVSCTLGAHGQYTPSGPCVLLNPISSISAIFRPDDSRRVIIPAVWSEANSPMKNRSKLSSDVGTCTSTTALLAMAAL